MPDYSLKRVQRDRLFFDKFEYCVLFRQDDVSCLRGLNRRKFERNLSFMPAYRARKGTNLQTVDDNLRQTFDVLTSAPTPIKIMISYHYCYVYHNDQAWADSLKSQCPYITVLEHSQAVVSRPRDVVSLLNPTHKYRTYFREKKVDATTKTRLANWISAQGEELKLAPSFDRWLFNPRPNNWRNLYSERYYFIEHNDRHYETMMSIITPELIRKTVPIQQRAK